MTIHRNKPATTPFPFGATAGDVVDGVDLSGRRVLVTGGGSGIGAETVRALAVAGAEVTVAARRTHRVEALAREIASVPGAGDVRAAALDLADLASVDALARSWSGPLDVLVTNSGIMALPTRTVSGSGWEMQLATNFLGHFALAEALRPALAAAPSARLVVVSSGAHRRAAFDFDDPHFERRPYDPWTAYGQSKTAGVLFTVGARRWAGDGITANALNPGYILTELQSHLDDDTMRAFGAMDDAGNLTPPSYYKTPAHGAATTTLLAASPLLEGVSGRYFEDNQESPVVPAGADGPGVAAHAVDPSAADRLWEYAAETLRAQRTQCRAATTI